MVTDSGVDYAYDNLFLVRIEVLNRGSVDKQSFSFGVTFHDKEQVIKIETVTPDRHHAVKIDQPIGPQNPTRTLDFSLIPFNRGDLYSLNALVVLDDAVSILQDPLIGSSEAVKFRKIPSLREIIESAPSLAIPVPDPIYTAVVVLNRLIRVRRK
jgi:hypothetical protein